MKGGPSILALLLRVWVVALLAGVPVAEAEPNVAAASDLKFALSEIAVAYERQTRRSVRISFGSSGIFFRQISEGAPFELFFSADEAYADALHRDGRTQGPGAAYAIGRIVLFVPKGSPVEPDSDLRDLAAALHDGRLRRLAMANPEHAPYGRAAREALTALALWPLMRNKLVLGENAAQAARFATAGGAQAGILPLSLVLAPELRELGSHAVIAAKYHRPLRQKAILMKGAGESARLFFEFVQRKEARAVLGRYGFELPSQDQ